MWRKDGVFLEQPYIAIWKVSDRQDAFAGRGTTRLKEVYALKKSIEITAVKVVQEIRVKKSTFYKLIREYDKTF